MYLKVNFKVSVSDLYHQTDPHLSRSKKEAHLVPGTQRLHAWGGGKNLYFDFEFTSILVNNYLFSYCSVIYLSWMKRST